MFSNLNMKKIVLWLFIIMVCAFVVSGVILAINGFEGTIFTDGGSGSSQNSASVDLEKSFSMDGVKYITVNTISEDVNVIPTDTNEIKVHFYGSKHKNTELKADLTGDKLEVKVQHKTIIGIHFSNQELKVDVYIPKAYVESFTTSTVSARLDIDGLSLKNLKYNSVSGDLSASGVTTEETEINTTSGEMDMEGFSGNLDFSSVSGDLDVKYKSYAGNDIKINTTSGNAKLKLLEDSQFKLSYRSTSGKLDNSFPITTSGSGGEHNISGSVGKGDGNISASTVSGDLEIYK